MASRFNRRIAWVSLCAGVAMLVPVSIGADTLSKVLTVSATVVTGCSNLTVNPMNFGSYPSGSATPLDATATVLITCDGGLPWSLDGIGGNYQGGIRQLLNGAGQSLQYGLFTDAAFTTIFGTTVGGTSLPGAGSTTLTLYGRVSASQSAAAGSYTDQIDVTLTF